MFAKTTRDAIGALVAADPDATRVERDAVWAALAGGPTPSAVLRPVSVSEAAELIGCHRNTVSRLVRSGALVALRGGDGRTRIVRSSIDDFMSGK